MQKARIRTGWKNRKREISVEEFANALSAICWRISLNSAKNLHQKDFIYDSDEQRIGVIREYLVFFTHCADRLMYQQIDDSNREKFITTLSKEGYRHYAQNAVEMNLSSPQMVDYLNHLNDTMTALSGFRFDQSEPGFEMYRLLGSRILEIMGHTQTNRWVIDQVMDIDGPDAYQIFKQSFIKLKRNSGF